MKIKLSVNLKYQSVVYVKFDLNSILKLGGHHKYNVHDIEIYQLFQDITWNCIRKSWQHQEQFITFINHEWSSLFTIMTKFTIKSCSAVTVRVPDSWTYQSCTDRLLKLHSHCIGNLSFLYWDYINKNFNYLQFSKLKTGRFFLILAGLTK